MFHVSLNEGHIRSNSYRWQMHDDILFSHYLVLSVISKYLSSSPSHTPHFFFQIISIEINAEKYQ